MPLSKRSSFLLEKKTGRSSSLGNPEEEILEIQIDVHPLDPLLRQVETQLQKCIQSHESCSSNAHLLETSRARLCSSSWIMAYFEQYPLSFFDSASRDIRVSIRQARLNFLHQLTCGGRGEESQAFLKTVYRHLRASIRQGRYVHQELERCCAATKVLLSSMRDTQDRENISARRWENISGQWLRQMFQILSQLCDTSQELIFEQLKLEHEHPDCPSIHERMWQLKSTLDQVLTELPDAGHLMEMGEYSQVQWREKIHQSWTELVSQLHEPWESNIHPDSCRDSTVDRSRRPCMSQSLIVRLTQLSASVGALNQETMNELGFVLDRASEEQLWLERLLDHLEPVLPDLKLLMELREQEQEIQHQIFQCQKDILRDQHNDIGSVTLPDESPLVLTHWTLALAQVGQKIARITRQAFDLPQEDRDLAMGKNEDVLLWNTCPITLETFQDPVIAADGHTYERHAITQWFRTSDPLTSPLTGLPLTSHELIPNHHLRQALIFLTRH